ncbi:hypothetical protein C8J57DRAFT_1134971 [Mycena rebaudengoi]|nr:hypothetical protein C8J57DRAFT_1134971 [Mycena rebaudengoi]
MATPATQFETTLDLYDIALLLNYERGSTEPRFRHAKLRDVALASASGDFDPPFQALATRASQEWVDCTGPKDGFIFSKHKPADEPDLPSNMLSTDSTPVPPKLQCLSPKQLETIFWQARGHDGCYICVTLLQHFFDLFPSDTPVRVRTAAGADYVTSASTRVILEFTLVQPKLMTLVHISDGATYITGSDETMPHAVVGFAKSGEGNVETILDLASLQFGDAGRGLGGRSIFAVESLDKFYDRLETITRGGKVDKTSARIRPSPHDEWLKRVAKKAKERWDARGSHGWCGHCGSPGDDLQKCSACHEARYCDAAHQLAAWPFHKRFCSGKKA